MKVLKWIAYILSGLVVVLVLALAIIYFMSTQKLAGGDEVTPDPITVPTDEVQCHA